MKLCMVKRPISTWTSRELPYRFVIYCISEMASINQSKIKQNNKWSKISQICVQLSWPSLRLGLSGVLDVTPEWPRALKGLAVVAFLPRPRCPIAVISCHSSSSLSRNFSLIAKYIKKLLPLLTRWDKACERVDNLCTLLYRFFSTISNPGSYRLLPTSKMPPIFRFLNDLISFFAVIIVVVHRLTYLDLAR